MNRPRLLILIILAVSLLGKTVLADPGSLATLYSKEQEVTVRRAATNSFVALEVGSELHAFDTIRVGTYGRAGIAFKDGGFVRLSSNTTLTLKPADAAAKSQPLEIIEGKSHFYSRSPKLFPTIKTPTVSAAVRGTEFVVEVSDRGTNIAVINGVVQLTNDYGQLRVNQGEQGSAAAGQAPAKAILVNPRDAVQWTLYFPLEATGASEIDGVDFSLVLEDFRRGEIDRLLARANNQPLLQSSIFLALGDTDRASAVLKNISNNAPVNELTIRLAQQALIAIAMNDTALATERLREAFSINDHSVPVLVVESYLYQATRDLPAARSSLERALTLAPRNSFVMTRLSEIELGFNNVDRARDLALSAQLLAPRAAYPNTVLGFIALIDGNTTEAESLFNAAIQEQSGSGLPRLGLGLLSIQRGNLADGSLEIQKASALEPTTSIYRSYLGKAYFEAEREDDAAKEYAAAIELDPNDPTPYLYSSFYNRSKNRPVNALNDIEASIERNDARAVYRSSLLLDRDLGMRSSALAQTYADLGFNAVAEVEAVKAIGRDYGNYSAHRFLADSDNTIIGADTSFSEARIANLLSPLSFNFLNTVGGEVTYTDYSALFDESQTRYGTDFIYDSRNDIFAAESYAAGKHGEFGYFMQYDTGFSGGSTHGAYSRDNRIDLVGQYQPTVDDRFIFETRYQYFTDQLPGGAVDESRTGALDFSLGYNRTLTPNSTLLVETIFDAERSSYGGDTVRNVVLEEIFEGLEERYDDEVLLDQDTDEDLNRSRTTVQHLYDSDDFSIVSGWQFLYTDADRSESSPALDDELLIFNDIDRVIRTQGDNNLTANDVYSYLTLHPTDWADVTIGGNYTNIETELAEVPPFISDDNSQDRYNQKYGLMLTPTENLTLRASYFESLRKSSLEDQAALEPTTVGGLNQRFNDLSGAESDNYGFGADYKIPGSTYFGGDWIHRQLHDTNTLVDTTYTINYDLMNESSSSELLGIGEIPVDQDYVRGYLYHILSDDLVSTLDYSYTNQESHDPFELNKLSTHKIASGLRYFDRTGLFFFLNGTWRDQTRDGSFYYDDGTSTFWVFDAVFGYRMPKRHGQIRFEILNFTGTSFTYDQTLGLEEFIQDDVAVRLLASFNL